MDKTVGHCNNTKMDMTHLGASCNGSCPHWGGDPLNLAPPPSCCPLLRPVWALVRRWTGLRRWWSPPCAPSWWTGGEKSPRWSWDSGSASESRDDAWPHPGSCATPARILTSPDQQEQGSTYLQHAGCGRHYFLLYALNNFPAMVTT